MVVLASGGATGYLQMTEWTLYGTADTSPSLTIAPATTFSSSVATPSLTGVAGDRYVPQDFSSSGLNIPAYVVSNTATTANTVAYSSFGPFAGEGSLYFPGGSAPRISFGVQSQFAYNWTSYDFTMECFVYHTSRPGDQRLLSRDNDILMYVSQSTYPNQLVLYSAGITSPTSGSFLGGTVPLNQWNHLAVSYIASTSTFYLAVNGSVTTVPKVTGTFQYTGTNNTNIDYWFGGSGTNIGYLSNFRFTRGQALYTSAFTPPTAPLQPIQGVTQAGLPYGTVLLLRNAPAPGRIQTTKFSGANSGSVLSFPPAAMTTYATALNAGYGQGTYVASASSEYTPGAYYAWFAFDKSAGTQWGATYSYTTNVPYGGTVRTVDVNGTSYAGEWLQIQKPSSIVLSSYSILPQSGPSNTLSAWYVLGSRDGTNWFLVDQRSGATWTSGVYNTYQVQSSQAFSYFRIVINVVSNGTGIGLPEWTLNGSIESVNITADGRLGVGVTNPARALEVAGDVVCAGTLSAGNPLMFRNALYNGDMRIAQRGTSFTNPNGTYTLDRWNIVSGTGLTVSQIQSGLTNFSNAVQIQTSSTTTQNIYLCQSLETRDVVRFQGQTVTVSLWYRIPTSFTGTWAPWVWSSTAVDAKLNDIGSGTGLGNGAMPNTTAWTYASFTTFVPTTVNSLGVMFLNFNNVVNGATLQITGVQLEKGSVATPFEVRPYATELALCQRYYEQSYSIGVAAGTNTSNGYVYTTNICDASGYGFPFVKYTVPKRAIVVPTFYTTSGTLGSWGITDPSGAVSTFVIVQSSISSSSFVAKVGIGGMNGQAGAAYGHWVANAEL
jgi:hypothetical protein